MTREEAKKQFTMNGMADFNCFINEFLIDKIYNDFESMTCDNCAYKRDTDVNGNFMSNEYFCVLRARCENKDFGCNKFKRKEV